MPDTRYSFKRRVFIAWGGNRELAIKVAQLVRDRHIDVIVGGEYLATDDEFHVGARVIAQMKDATDAIILAMPEKAYNGKRDRFRENLMFEFGYLLNRLSPTNISVCVTEGGKSGLPSDLHGATTFVIPENIKSEASKASYIAKVFKQKDNRAKFIAFDLFADWPKWWSFIERQLTGDEAPQPQLLGRVLVSAFAPALYSEELEKYSRLLRFIDPLDNGENEYVTMAKSAAEYLTTVRSDRTFVPGDFTDIKRRFSDISGYSDKFLASVAQNFMGLCLRHEAFLAKGEDDVDTKERLLQYALEHFRKAQTYFSQAEIDDRTREIWLAYAYSNVAITMSMLGDHSGCLEYMEKSVASRSLVLKALAGSSTSRIYKSYLAEYYINCVKLARLHRVKSPEYQNAIREVEKRKRYVGGYVWTLLEKELATAREAFGETA